MRREDTDMGPASENVITFDDEMAPNGKLLQQSDANLCSSSLDNVSVCSCTCYPRHVSFTKNYTSVILMLMFPIFYRRTFKASTKGKVDQVEFIKMMLVELKKNYTALKLYLPF